MNQHLRSTLAGLLTVAGVILVGPAALGQEADGLDETAAAEAEPANGEESGRVASSEVALARFTTAIEDREPVDSVAFLTNDQDRVLFFSDLRMLKGETVTHRWEYKGEILGEVAFEVRGDRWRVWSSKRLQPDWLGRWTVSIVKSDGEVLASESFTYQE